jgi:hypothetical protein
MGWQMYALARQDHSVNESAFLVGMLGLAAFVPVLPADPAGRRGRPTATTARRCCWSA